MPRRGTSGLELIVIDNLVNVQGPRTTRAHIHHGELHWIARATGAHVQVLVHASENSTPNPLRPSRMKDIINKLRQAAGLSSPSPTTGQRTSSTWLRSRAGKAKQISWQVSVLSRM